MGRLRVAVGIHNQLALVVFFWDAGFAEILLGDYINGNLGPVLGGINIFHPKDLRTIGVLYLRRSLNKIDPAIWRFTLASVKPGYFQDNAS